MIAPKKFIKEFKKNNLKYFTGVPDSILSGLINYLNLSNHGCVHRIAANEGSAISQAIGYFIAKKKVPVVYFQNSGISHASNPLASVADQKIFGIPMILLVGYRGDPKIKDEPQHYRIGPNTKKILKSININSVILNKRNFKSAIYKAKKRTLKLKQPQALIVSKNLISKFKNSKVINKNNKNFSYRIKYLELLAKLGSRKDFFVCTTGNTAREMYVLNEKYKKNHTNSFYCIGAMGHANQIGLELSLQKKKKNIYILDGDGAALMHMGNLSTIANYKPKNLIHIIFNNGVHESTGLHNTTNQKISFKKVYDSLGYKRNFLVKKISSFKKILKKKVTGPIGIEILIKPGTVDNLPRPNKKPKELLKLIKI